MYLSPNGGAILQKDNPDPSRKGFIACRSYAPLRSEREQNMMDDDERIEDDADIRNDLWVKENYVGLCDEFPNQWIAVADQDVIASAITKWQVEKKAKEIAQERRFSVYFMEPSALPP